MTKYDELAVRAMLAASVQTVGSLRGWARRHQCSAPYVSDVMLGKRSPGKKILTPLGLYALPAQRPVRLYARLPQGAKRAHAGRSVE